MTVFPLTARHRRRIVALCDRLHAQLDALDALPLPARRSKLPPAMRGAGERLAAEARHLLPGLLSHPEDPDRPADLLASTLKSLMAATALLKNDNLLARRKTRQTYARYQKDG